MCPPCIHVMDMAFMSCLHKEKVWYILLRFSLACDRFCLWLSFIIFFPPFLPEICCSGIAPEAVADEFFVPPSPVQSGPVLYPALAGKLTGSGEM